MGPPRAECPADKLAQFDGAAKMPLRDVSLLDTKGCELELVSTTTPDAGAQSQVLDLTWEVLMLFFSTVKVPFKMMQYKCIVGGQDYVKPPRSGISGSLESVLHIMVFLCMIRGVGLEDAARAH